MSGGICSTCSKTSLLHVGLVNADGAAAQFDAVDHDVVMLAAHFFGIGGQQRNVLRHRRGERMMAGIPAVLFLVEGQQAGNPPPRENQSGWRSIASLPRHFQNVGAIEADFAQDFAGVEPLVRGEENQVAFLDFQFAGQGGLFGVVEKLDDGRFPFALLHFDVRPGPWRRSSWRIRSSFRSGPGWRRPGPWR